MPAVARLAASASRPNWGFRRERGMVRTSTSCAMSCARRRAINSSTGRVPWPMVRITRARPSLSRPRTAARYPCGARPRPARSPESAAGGCGRGEPTPGGDRPRRDAPLSDARRPVGDRPGAGPSRARRCRPAAPPGAARPARRVASSRPSAAGRPRRPAGGDRSRGDSVLVEGAGALERPPPLLPCLRLLTLSLDRRLLVVGAPLHLLEEAIFLHLFLERLQRGLDLVVDDLDPHSAAPKVRGRSIAAHRFRAVHNVHLDEPLRALRDRAGDRREDLVRLLDDLACVVDDPPAPVGIRRGRERDDLHVGLAPTTGSRCARRRRRSDTLRRAARRPSPSLLAWRTRP